MSFFIWILWFFVLVKEVFYFNSTTHLIWTLSLVPSVIIGFDCYSSRKFMEISQENIMCVDNSWHFVTLPLVTQNKRRHLIPWAYSDFKWQGWSNRDKTQNPKKFLGLPTKPKTIPGPKLTAQKSHAEFPSLKNIQKALNDLIRKMKNNITPRDTGVLWVLDPDLDISWGGGGWSQTKYFFCPLGLSLV